MYGTVSQPVQLTTTAEVEQQYDGSHWGWVSINIERGTGFGSSRCVSTQTEYLHGTTIVSRGTSSQRTVITLFLGISLDICKLRIKAKNQSQLELYKAPGTTPIFSIQHPAHHSRSKSNST
ncbi:uncharacterized protein LAJ45_05796 [Morchella importuna]|uniref:uncharacterized protein n=1 Tax=Morchella importuna TaxID=1174673 RepID=UPI001E8EDEDD|nr:uncharacterized protein LAJ45_05796 [Morchella importuna]KAH8150110.1 hypothetical protein LAJ45_05796 [Morchella importuna]